MSSDSYHIPVNLEITLLVTVSHWSTLGLQPRGKGTSKNIHILNLWHFSRKIFPLPPPFFFAHKIKVWRYRNKNSPVPRAARYFRVIYCRFQAKPKSALPFGITVRQETLNTKCRAGFGRRLLTHLIDSPNPGRQPRVTCGKS